jgi:hypothetical protein
MTQWEANPGQTTTVTRTSNGGDPAIMSIHRRIIAKAVAADVLFVVPPSFLPAAVEPPPKTPVLAPTVAFTDIRQVRALASALHSAADILIVNRLDTRLVSRDSAEHKEHKRNTSC